MLAAIERVRKRKNQHAPVRTSRAFDSGGRLLRANHDQVCTSPRQQTKAIPLMTRRSHANHRHASMLPCASAAFASSVDIMAKAINPSLHRNYCKQIQGVYKLSPL